MAKTNARRVIITGETKEQSGRGITIMKTGNDRNFFFAPAAAAAGLLLLLMTGAFFSARAAVAAPADSPLYYLLRKNYGPDASLSTKFSLTIYWSVREKEEKKQGKIFLATGDRFRVTLEEETFVSDGGTFWHHSAGTNQVAVRNLSDVDRFALPSQIFTRYLASCPFREEGRGKNEVRLYWKSDSAGNPYTEIRVWAGEKDGRIRRCVMTDNNGNTFTYIFTSVVFGKNIPRETFEFEIPANARIVDMRH